MEQRWVSRSLTYADIEVARASGSIVETVSGDQLIDFVSGISCLNLGHSYPPVVEAIQRQAGAFMHQFMIIGRHAGYENVCRLLAELSPCRGEGEHKSILSTTGAEAIENAVKIARSVTGRTAVISFDRSFHGRTLLGMSLSGFTRYKSGFGPFAPDVYQAEAPYAFRGISDERALQSFADMLGTRVDPGNVACVIIEPVQGEGGLIPMSATFLRGLRAICDSYGMLLVFDENQTGMRRTGGFWAADTLAVQPDLLVSGGSLGGGLPLSAVTGAAELLDAVRPGGLGGTFSGTPLATAGAQAMLAALQLPEVVERAHQVERSMDGLVAALGAEHDTIGEVRQLGPFYGLEFTRAPGDRAPNARVVAETIRQSRARGLLIDYCGRDKNILRLIPALNAPEALLEEGMSILSQSIRAAHAQTQEKR
ncbi:aspartate aminotransferase family protein [Leucobacter albus]|uniref:Aspartate aminotransferase family protein n=1 Tax=Leucobacter albus TaxID=272210 RepID=A0ABW3TNV9_9MICO